MLALPDFNLDVVLDDPLDAAARAQAATKQMSKPKRFTATLRSPNCFCRLPRPDLHRPARGASY
jgi:hypothetical protein